MSGSSKYFSHVWYFQCIFLGIFKVFPHMVFSRYFRYFQGISHPIPQRTELQRLFISINATKDSENSSESLHEQIPILQVGEAR